MGITHGSRACAMNNHDHNMGPIRLQFLILITSMLQICGEITQCHSVIDFNILEQAYNKMVVDFINVLEDQKELVFYGYQFKEQRVEGRPTKTLKVVTQDTLDYEITENIFQEKFSNLRVSLTVVLKVYCVLTLVNRSH